MVGIARACSYEIDFRPFTTHYDHSSNIFQKRHMLPLNNNYNNNNKEDQKNNSIEDIMSTSCD